MKNEKCKIAVFGALNVDVCGAARTRFVPGDSNPGVVMDSLGGVGWNMARSAAALGARTAFFAVLGKDGYAARIEAEAAAFGVDIGACRWADEPNSRYVYITDEQGDMVAAVNDMRLCERFDRMEAERMLPLAQDASVALLDANLLPETLELEVMDLCSVLSNLLDNAIEGCRGAAAPKITVVVKLVKEYISINITNTVKEDVLKKNPHLLTSKKDREFHGLGTQVVRDLVARYDGVAEFGCTNQVFYAQAMMKNCRQDRQRRTVS